MEDLLIFPKHHALVKSHQFFAPVRWSWSSCQLPYRQDCVAFRWYKRCIRWTQEISCWGPTVHFNPDKNLSIDHSSCTLGGRLGSGPIEIFDSCGPNPTEWWWFFSFFFFSSNLLWSKLLKKGLYPIGFYLLLLVLWSKSSIHVRTDTCRITVEAWRSM